MMMTSVRSLVLTTAALAMSNNSHTSVDALKLTLKLSAQVRARKDFLRDWLLARNDDPVSVKNQLNDRGIYFNEDDGHEDEIISTFLKNYSTNKDDLSALISIASGGYTSPSDPLLEKYDNVKIYFRAKFRRSHAHQAINLTGLNPAKFGLAPRESRFAIGLSMLFDLEMITALQKLLETQLELEDLEELEEKNKKELEAKLAVEKHIDETNF